MSIAMFQRVFSLFPAQTLFSPQTAMTFLQLPTEIHTSLLLEWIPFYKEYSALDVAVSERRYWLELLRSPVLVVDPPLAIAPDRSYYTWLESRQLKVATLRVNMAEMPSIKSMRFPSVTKVVAVFSEEIKDTAALADVLEANSNVSHLCTEAHYPLRLNLSGLLALVKHPLELKVLDLRGTPIDPVSNPTATVGGIFALLYQVGSTVEELRLRFRSAVHLSPSSAEIVETIAHHCCRLRKLEWVDTSLPIQAICLLCDSNQNITELRCCVEVTAAEADSACQEVLDRLPKLENLSLPGSHKTKLPALAEYPCLQSIEADEGSVDLIQRKVVIRDFVISVRAHEIFMTLPCAMRSVSYGSRRFSRNEVLPIAQKHGAELESISFEFAALTEGEWQQLWLMCPKLVLVKNPLMMVDIVARSFEQRGCSIQQAMAILLTVPVGLLSIRLDTSGGGVLPLDILNIASRHGATLQKFDYCLDVAQLGLAALEHFFQMCSQLMCLDLSRVDAESMRQVATYCTRKMTQLTVRKGQQQVMDAAIISVLQEHPQLTKLTLVDCPGVTSALLNHIGSLTALTISGDSGISRFDIVSALAAGKLSNLTKLCLGWKQEHLLYIKTIMQVAFKDIKRPIIV